MDHFFRWVSGHALTVLIIIGVLYAVGYIISNRKSLFYKE